MINNIINWNCGRQTKVAPLVPAPEALTELICPLPSSIHSTPLTGGPHCPFNHSSWSNVRYLIKGRLTLVFKYTWLQSFVQEVHMWSKPDQSILPWTFSHWSFQRQFLSSWVMRSLGCEPTGEVEAETKDRESWGHLVPSISLALKLPCVLPA